MRIAITIVASLALASTAAGATAPLDPAFNGGALVTIPIGSSAELKGLAAAPDGSLAATGTAVVDNRVQTFLTHRLPGGAFDPAFGGGKGYVVNAFGGAADATRDATAVAIQADGHILVTGTTGGRLFVARYAADGTLDPLFGGGGVYVDPDLQFDPDTGPLAMYARPDGGAVVVGSIPSSVGRSVLAIAFTPIGGIDTAFANRGVFVTQLGKRGFQTPADSVAASLGVDAAGNYLLGGERTNRKGAPRALLVKLDPSGAEQPIADAAGALPEATAVRAIRVETDGITVAGSALDKVGDNASFVAKLDTGANRVWNRTLQLGRPSRTHNAFSVLSALGADGLVAGAADEDIVALRVDPAGNVACTDRTVIPGQRRGLPSVAGNVVGTTQANLPTLAGLLAAPPATGAPSATTGRVIKVSKKQRALTGVIDPGCAGEVRATFVAGRHRVSAGRLAAGTGPQAVRAVVKAKPKRRYRLVVSGSAAR
ncbi:MAG: hypothetical protein QOF76_3221 [Solirubrobacteraceae bacterium]|nr:hypothetical protein [Solirubrobacteraceae bacterium]